MANSVMDCFLDYNKHVFSKYKTIGCVVFTDGGMSAPVAFLGSLPSKFLSIPVVAADCCPGDEKNVTFVIFLVSSSDFKYIDSNKDKTDSTLFDFYKFTSN